MTTGLSTRKRSNTIRIRATAQQNDRAFREVALRSVADESCRSPGRAALR